MVKNVYSLHSFPAVLLSFYLFLGHTIYDLVLFPAAHIHSSHLLGVSNTKFFVEWSQFSKSKENCATSVILTCCHVSVWSRLTKVCVKWQSCVMEVLRRTRQYHNITEYLKLEGTHKDYKYQLGASRRATQNSNPMSEDSVQTLL